MSDPANSGPGRRITVVSVVGKGRSGTTLLDLVLGSLSGWFSLGEVWRWESFHRFDENRCGCGSPLPRCEVWGPVLARIAEEHPDGEHVWRSSLRWEKSVARWGRVPRLLRAASGTEVDWEPLRALCGYASLLYRTVAEEAGARVLVDSSNWPANPVTLGLVPGVDAVVVHLVRDPRAVAFSWQREKSLDDGRGDMPRHPVTQSALSWTARNLLAEAVRRRPAAPSLLARYENLVRSPTRTAASVASAVDDDADLTSIRGRTVRLPPNHTVAGNPMRFQTGDVELRMDTEWIREQSAGRQLLVTVLTLPLLLRYGYPIRPG